MKWVLLLTLNGVDWTASGPYPTQHNCENIGSYTVKMAKEEMGLAHAAFRCFPVHPLPPALEDKP